MSHHCAAALLDSQLGAADWLKSGYSPGKRSDSLLGSPMYTPEEGAKSAGGAAIRYALGLRSRSLRSKVNRGIHLVILQRNF